MIAAVWAWLSDAGNWGGADGIWVRLTEHVLLTAVATAIAVLLGLPLALWLGHRGRGGTWAINIAGIGRATPIVALLSLFSLGVFGSATLGPFGRAGAATLVTLALFALPPIITNTYVGIREVDADTVEAARGIGMAEGQVLRRVELPLALPMIVSGVRLAVVQVWATATVAALVAGPGLGRIIVHGYDSENGAEVIGASLIVAGIALLLERLLAMVQRRLEPGGRTAN